MSLPVLSAKPRKLDPRIIIYGITFIMGGAGIAYEYTLSKISSDLMGNSVAQWAVVIGLMMLCMGIGSDLQKYFKDEHVLNRFLLVEIIQGLIGGFGPVILFWVFGAQRDYFVLVQYLFIITIGVIIGFEIPFLARINEQYTRELKVNIGAILRMDYVGAFVGAMFWLFLLLPHVSLLQIGFVLGAMNVSVAAVAFAYFGGGVKKRWTAIIVIVASLITMAVGFVLAPEWNVGIEQQLYLDRIIFTETTPYQHIVMTEHRSGDRYLYINGNLQFSSADEHIYHEYLVHPAMLIAPARNRVLILGGGDGLALREVLKYSDVREVVLVDIDPAMTDLAMSHPIFRELNRDSLRDARVMVLENSAISAGPTVTVFEEDRSSFGVDDYAPTAEVSVINMDAAAFVEQVPGLFDVIIADFPDPNSNELAKLYSRGFYRRISSKLSRFGVFIQQGTSPYHSKEAFLSIGRTAEAGGLELVPIHDSVPSFGEWGWWIGGRGDVYSQAGLRESLENVVIPSTSATRYLTEELLAGSLNFGRGRLDTDETEVNTIFNNLIYLYYDEAARRGR